MFAGDHGASEGKTDNAVPHSGGSFDFGAALTGGDHASGVVIPDAHLLFAGNFKRAGLDLIVSDAERHFVVHDYFKAEKHPSLLSPDGASLSADVVDALTGHINFAQAGADTSAAKIIGTVAKLTGSATAIRNGVAVELNIGDKVYKGDAVQSGTDSALGISFIDGTAFSLSSNARMVLNEMVYDPNGSSNSSLLSLVQGAISFVAGDTAKNGNMLVDTPVATMGIRGTAVLVEISADNGPTKFSVLIEPGGRSGSYILTDKVTGLPVGSISQPGLVTSVSSAGINQPLTIVESPKTATDLLNEREVVKLAFSIAFPQFNFDDANPRSKFALGSSVNSLADLGIPLRATEGPTFAVAIPGISKEKSLTASGTDHANDIVLFLQPTVSNSTALVEDSVALNRNLSAAGTLVFPNLDLIDTHSVTIGLESSTSNPHLPGYTDNFSQIGTFAVGEITTGTNNSAIVGWSFTLADNNPVLQSLAKGETITQVYAISFRDHNGSLVTQDVKVTLVGVNDIPTIVSSSNDTPVLTEDSVAANLNLSAAGTITFRDVDLIDTHTATFALKSSTSTAHLPGFTDHVSQIGTFALTSGPSGVSEVTNDTNNTGTVGWSFTLADNDPVLQSLPIGQTITQVYTVTITDNNGAQVTEDVTVTLVGDAGVISGTSSGSVEIDDDGAVVYGSSVASGTLTDSDVDNTFVAAAAGSITDHGYGTYQMTAAGVWTYTLNNSNPAVQALNDGEHLTDTFTVSTVEGTAQVVTVTINDDDPLIAIGPAGVAGSEINLGATAPVNPGTLVTVTVSDLPSGWSLNRGVQVDDHTWTIQTSDVQSLTVTTPSSSVGAVVLHVSESWTKPDSGTASAQVFDNVESYAVGSPIFALAANDQLTGSSGADQFVFAQPIGHDVIYSFDAASDKIDLVGFSGFSDFRDVAAHLSDDGAGSAVLTLASDETITLHGVNSALLSASNFQFNQQTLLENLADMIIGNGATLPLSGIIENTGMIELNSTGGETSLQLSQNGATFHGGGQIVLSDSNANIISGTGAGVALNNEDNTISGAGELGNGGLSLTNAGTINATGTHALVVDTGSNSVVNSGVLEASGTGGLTVASSIANSGALWANGATLTVLGELSGSGNAIIDGAGTLDFESSSTANVAFAPGAAGTLKLGDLFHFKGAISGFGSSDRIDLVNVDFGTASIGYHENAAGTGGMLTVSDGAHTAELALLGHYSAENFSVVTDQAKGTLITYVSHDLVV
jgi:VCBS repeat-containing protein